MTEKDIVRRLLAGWLPDCPIDDIRQAVLDAWTGDKYAAQYAACVIVSRLPGSSQAEQAAERAAERAAENWVGGFEVY